MSKCRICSKSVYPMDPQINLDGSLFHKPCAKCKDCSCQITISNFTKGEQDGQLILLCKTHYFKRFKEGGSYVGGEKFQVKASRDVQASSRRTSITDSAVPAAAVSDESESATAGSVRERIASLRMNEKPKVESNGAQPAGRRASFDQSKSKSNDGQVKESEPSMVPDAASLPPAPENAPIAPPVPVVEDASSELAASSSVTEDSPVKEETVIDASPENGVSTPCIAPDVEESAPTDTSAATVEETPAAAEEESS